MRAFCMLSIPILEIETCLKMGGPRRPRPLSIPILEIETFRSWQLVVSVSFGSIKSRSEKQIPGSRSTPGGYANQCEIIISDRKTHAVKAPQVFACAPQLRPECWQRGGHSVKSRTAWCSAPHNYCESKFAVSDNSCFTCLWRHLTYLCFRKTDFCFCRRCLELLPLFRYSSTRWLHSVNR